MFEKIEFGRRIALKPVFTLAQIKSIKGNESDAIFQLENEIKRVRVSISILWTKSPEVMNLQGDTLFRAVF